MASLLDKVLNAKDSPTADSLLSPADDQPHKLEDGSVIYDSTIAAINRVFEYNPNLCKREVADHTYEMYNGRKRIDLKNEFQMLNLVRGDWTPKTKFQLALFCRLVTEIAPLFSFDGYIISDGLYWDCRTSTLKHFTEEDNIRSVV